MSSILNNLFQNTSGALRTKSGTQGGIKPADYSSKILLLPTGGLTPVNAKEVNYIAGDTRGRFQGITAGMFIELQKGGGSTNLANLLGHNVYVLDSAIIYSDSNSSRQALLCGYNTSDLEIVVLQISGGQFEVLDTYAINGEYNKPARIMGMDNDRFVVQTIKQGNDDNDCAITIYTLENSKITPAYTKNISIKNITPGYDYNNHAEFNMLVQYHESADENVFFIMFTYTSSGMTPSGTDFITVASIPVNDQNKESSTATQKVNINPFQINNGKALNPAYVGNMRSIWPIVNSDTGALTLCGVYCNPYNVFKINRVTTNLTNVVFAQILTIAGDTYLVYSTDGVSLYYNKLTINTNFRNGCGITLGEPVILYNSENPFVNIQTTSKEHVNGDSAIISLINNNGGVFDMNYLEFTRDSETGTLTAGNLVTLGTVQHQLFNSIDYLSDGSLVTYFGDGANTEIETCSSSGGSIESGGVNIAYPATEIINGIAKTGATTGNMGIAYILNTEDYPKEPSNDSGPK